MAYHMHCPACLSRCKNVHSFEKHLQHNPFCCQSIQDMVLQSYMQLPKHPLDGPMLKEDPQQKATTFFEFASHLLEGQAPYVNRATIGAIADHEEMSQSTHPSLPLPLTLREAINSAPDTNVKHFLLADYRVQFLNDYRVPIGLVHLIRKQCIPQGSFRLILDLIPATPMVNLRCSNISFEGIMRLIIKHFPTPNIKMHSIQIKCVPQELPIQAYSSIDVLHKILRHPLMQDTNSIHVGDPDRPWMPYIPNKEFISSILDGDVWRRVVQKCNPDKEIVIPLMMYSDTSQPLKNARAPLSPVVLYTPMIKHDALKDLSCYHTWFFMPKIPDACKETRDMYGSNNERMGLKPRDRMRVLSHMINDLNQAIHTLSSNAHAICLGGKVFVRRIKFILLGVQGDLEFVEEMCGRFASGRARMNRRCDCPYNHADNFLFCCTPTDYHHLSHLSHLLMDDYSTEPNFQMEGGASIMEALHEHSVHVCINAFEEAPWPDCNIDSIYQNTPVDYLHCLHLGLEKYLANNLCAKIKNPQRITIERLMHSTFQYCRRYEACPRTNFYGGVFNLKKLNGVEIHGFIWNIFMVAVLHPQAFEGLSGISEEGVDECKKLSQFMHFKHTLDDDVHVQTPEIPSKPSLMQIIDLLDHVLVMNALSTCSRIPRQQLAVINKSVTNILGMLVCYLPRCKLSWQLQKFHEWRHILDDILKFGLPLDFGCSEGERLMKEVYLRDCRMSNRTCTRQINQHSLELMRTMQYIEEYQRRYSSKRQDTKPVGIHPTLPKIHSIQFGKEIRTSPHWSENQKPNVRWNLALIDFLNCFLPRKQDLCLEYTSCLKHNNKLIRAEPFIKFSPRFDWVEYTDGSPMNSLIGKVLFIFRKRGKTGWSFMLHQASHDPTFQRKLHSVSIHTLNYSMDKKHPCLTVVHESKIKRMLEVVPGVINFPGVINNLEDCQARFIKLLSPDEIVSSLC